MLKFICFFLCSLVATCQLPFTIKFGVYGESNGVTVGTTVELDPSFVKQKK